MAQTGFTPIALYYSATASAAPTAGNLVPGELAINTADGRLYYKDSAGVVQVIGTKGGVGSSTTTQVLYNSSGLVVGSANMTFSGTALTLANDASISGLTVGKGGGAVSTNSVVGGSSLGANTTGSNNTVFGQYALPINTTGSNNTSVGQASLSLNTTGGNNVAFGVQALTNNTTASNNTAVGYQAGYSNTTGTYLTYLGYQAGYAATGNYNVAIGGLAFNAASNTGTDSVAVGVQSLTANTSGSFNAAVGKQSLQSNTTGSYNSAFGMYALSSNTTASNNTAVGYRAGYNVTGGNNTLYGTDCGYNLTSGTKNTFIGGTNSTTGAAGSEITTGSANTIIGAYSGNQGGLDIRTASNYIVLSDGDGNPRGVFDSSGNFLVGNSTAVGTSTVYCYRSDANYNFTANNTNAGTQSFFAFRYNGSGVGSISGNNSNVTYSTASDYRLKENIAPMTGALNTVSALKPVTYNWKADGSDGQGFIAHELAEIVPDCVTGEKDAVDAEGNPVYQGIDTSFLVATLTAAIQELKAELDATKAEVAALKAK